MKEKQESAKEALKKIQEKTSATKEENKKATAKKEA